MAQEARKTDLRVGPGTPLGTALRQFWIPACASAELSEPDGDPLRVWLLGQSFVAFRDTNGKVGLLDEACPHRKASLVYGNSAGGGLRCLWHQWKFAVDGAVLETPNVSDCNYKDRVRAKAYPVQESGGLVWTYLGPESEAPPFPRFHWSALPLENVMVVPIDLDCHFIRPLEGLVDSSHVALLHVDAMKLLPAVASQGQGDKSALTTDFAPKFELELTDFGFHYAATRKVSAELGADAQVRVTAYAAPFTCFIPPGDHAHISVPQDDGHTKFYNVVWSTTERLDEPAARDARLELYGLTDEIIDRQGVRSIPPGPGPLGQRNHFVQDRAAMRSGESYSGGFGLTVEDAVMTCSIGSANDYDGEHLVPADVAIVRLRRLMKELSQQGAAGKQVLIAAAATPPEAITAPSGLLAEGANWRELVPSHRPMPVATT